MITVCMATYNGEKYIEEQLESVLMQLHSNDEVIISDDGSGDSTVDLIRTFNDPRIRLLVGNNFFSPTQNFENALKYAKGDYIFLCDQDDVWLPDKVESMLQYLLQYDLVVSDCKVVDAELNVIKNTYLGCCIAFRKEVLGYILPFPRNIAMHDIWIGLSVEMHSNSFFLPRQLILYRRHGSNVSFGGEGSKYSLMYKIKYRLCMLFYLLKRKYLNK